MIRTCLISYSIYENDNRVIRYAETLAARGDVVDVIALRRAGEPSDLQLNGVRVFRVQERKHNEKRRLSYLWRIVKFFFRASALLTRMHMELQYDLVHVHSVPDFLVYAAWFPRLTGCKVILDIHDILPEFYASKFEVDADSLLFKVLLLIERKSSAFADHVIIANDLWRERLIGRSVEPSKCTAILNYPDQTIFRRRGNREHDGKFRIMYPGTLNWHQGVDLAIRAMGRVRRKAPQAEFHIYGIGAAQQMLMDLARDLNLEEAVVFHGPKPFHQIPTIMENADVVVVPKRRDSFGNEAFSTKTLEAMSVGVAVVLADTDIDRYYFDDSTVKFFRAGDEEDLANALLCLIEKPEVREKFAQTGIAFASQNAWETHKWRYLDIVDQLTGKASAQVAPAAAKSC